MSIFQIGEVRLKLNNRQVIDITKQNEKDAVKDAIKHRTKFQKVTDFFHITSHKKDIKEAFEDHYKNLNSISYNLAPDEKSIISVLMLRDNATNKRDFDNRLNIKINNDKLAILQFNQPTKTIRLGQEFEVDKNKPIFKNVFNPRAATNNIYTINPDLRDTKLANIYLNPINQNYINSMKNSENLDEIKLQDFLQKQATYISEVSKHTNFLDFATILQNKSFKNLSKHTQNEILQHQAITEYNKELDSRISTHYCTELYNSSETKIKNFLQSDTFQSMRYSTQEIISTNLLNQLNQQINQPLDKMDSIKPFSAGGDDAADIGKKVANSLQTYKNIETGKFFESIIHRDKTQNFFDPKIRIKTRRPIRSLNIETGESKIIKFEDITEHKSYIPSNFWLGFSTHISGVGEAKSGISLHSS